MDTLDGMRTLISVINEGSFTRAATRLSISPQLVSKYIGQLEARLGTRLLNRSTRRLSVTEAGQAYFERCVHILAEIDELEDAVGDMSVTARGTLRINSPMSFGEQHLATAVAAYQRKHTEVRVDMTLDDRVVDVVSEGFDLAIRIGQLGDSALVARHLAPVNLVVCGAPDYLDERGVPQSPEDLAQHDCLGYTYWSERDHWRFEADGRHHDVKVDGRLRANNGTALRRAAVAGNGLILQPTFIVGDDLRDGRLVRVLTDFTIKPVNVYAVYAHRQYLSSKVRTFVDFLSVHLGSPPYWDQDL